MIGVTQSNRAVLHGGEGAAGTAMFSWPAVGTVCCCGAHVPVQIVAGTGTTPRCLASWAAPWARPSTSRASWALRAPRVLRARARTRTLRRRRRTCTQQPAQVRTARWRWPRIVGGQHFLPLAVAELRLHVLAWLPFYGSISLLNWVTRGTLGTSTLQLAALQLQYPTAGLCTWHGISRRRC